jgi:phosphoenolpyruvate carboxykinase (GTP)
MADYFQHWLDMEKKTETSKLPKIFFVNWFRRDEKRKFMWPGFSDNVRVLKWVFERCFDAPNTVETPIGLLPDLSKFDTEGLNVSKETLQKLFEVNHDDWIKEMDEMKGYLGIFADTLPKDVAEELKTLYAKLG